MSHFHEIVEFLLRAPFRAPRPFLVELAEIPEVVAIVAVAQRFVGLARRREPDGSGAEVREVGQDTRQASPVGIGRTDVLAVGRFGRGVPFVRLEEQSVLRCGIGVLDMIDLDAGRHDC